MIQRCYQHLETYLSPGKVLLLLGPRQAGKTTLVKAFLERYDKRILSLSGDSLSVQQTFGSQELSTLQRATEGYDLLFIDEAQRIPDIGWSLKILADSVPQLSIIATGSSSFELLGQAGEPLTGRKTTLQLYPVAEMELALQETAYERDAGLEDRLVYGSYPAVLTAATLEAKRATLSELLNSYLLKDILELERVKSSKLLLDLLRLLAYQIGSEVSMAGLGGQLGIDTKTVGRYLDLLEKSYVLFSLRGYSRNLRSEASKMAKYYFYDLGIRNAVIENYNPVKQRDDIGQLWENYMFMERKKYRAYAGLYANEYFWRTWQGQEIDLVEEREGNLFGYEFKWPDKKTPRTPHSWREAYPKAAWAVITPGKRDDLIVKVDNEASGRRRQRAGWQHLPGLQE